MTTRTPEYIVTSDRWSRDPYIVFSDEKVESMIPSEWVSDRLAEVRDQEDNTEATYDTVMAEMVDDFIAENDSVDEAWPDMWVCRSGNSYWRYDNDGMVSYAGDYDSIDEYKESLND